LVGCPDGELSRQGVISKDTVQFSEAIVGGVTDKLVFPYVV